MRPASRIILCAVSRLMPAWRAMYAISRPCSLPHSSSSLRASAASTVRCSRRSQLVLRRPDWHRLAIAQAVARSTTPFGPRPRSASGETPHAASMACSSGGIGRATAVRDCAPWVGRLLNRRRHGHSSALQVGTPQVDDAVQQRARLARSADVRKAVARDDGQRGNPRLLPALRREEK
jgi:hypothetical protein